ncbi:MAG TPA: hypothetical protein VFL87_07310, partial [Thermoleophilaceae bacterium]|nr:hypothetical protein [Thermoleophilaceae bacterium]
MGGSAHRSVWYQLAREAAAGNGRASASTDGARSDSDDLLLSWRENGDRRARAAFIERNLPHARRLARRYERTHEPLEDLVQ